MNILSITLKEILLATMIIILLVGSLVVAMLHYPTTKQKQDWDEEDIH